MNVPNVPLNAVQFYVGAHMPRGVRNNNPGNIRLGDKWLGLCTSQDDGAFCQFATIEYGIRALAYILRIGYFQRRGLNTIRKIIQRWAPPSENDTYEYILDVARDAKYGADEPLNLDDDGVLSSLVVAIIKHENGAQPYSGLQIISGIRLLRGTANGAG